MSNPRFVKAMEGAMRGRRSSRKAVAHALKQMNVPTRTELKRALARIETLEREVAALQAKAKRTRPRAAAPGRPRGGAQGPKAKPAPAGRPPLGPHRHHRDRVVPRRRACCGGSSSRAARDAVVAVDITAPPTTLHGVRHRMVDLTLPGADQRLVRRVPGGARRHRRPRRLLHEPAARRRLLPRARVDRDAAPGGGGGRRPACGTSSCARSPRSTARAARTRTSSPRTAARRALPARLGARQGRGGGARVLLRPALPRARTSPSCASRRSSGPACYTFYTRLFSKRVVPVVLGLRPARAAPAPGRRPRRGRRRAREGAVAGSSTWCPGHDLAAHGAPPRGQAHRRRAARRRLPAGRPVVGGRGRGRRRAASSTTCASSSWPTARRPGASWASRRATRAATRSWRTCEYRYPETAVRARAQGEREREKPRRGRRQA